MTTKHSSNDTRSSSSFKSLQLKKLTAEQIAQIDELLASLGEYGEVHLVVQRGELRYINKMESHRAWNNEGESET